MQEGKLVVAICNAMLTAGKEKTQELVKEMPKEEKTESFLSALTLSCGVMVITQIAKNAAKLNKIPYKVLLAIILNEIIEVEGLE